MAGNKSQLTLLATRKQLLLVESELNRANLLNDLRDFKNDISVLKNQLQAAGSLAASAAKLAAIFSAIGMVFTQRDIGESGKPSWFSTLLNGARTVARLWATLRSHLK